MSRPIYEDVVMAGFGGQGLMFIGKLLAYSAMKEGRHVTWIPSYGIEMRGGTANCTVIISSDPIGSPVVAYPRSAIVMNQPSFETFRPRVSRKGIIFMNTSLITPEEKRKDIRVIEVPANEIAIEIGSERVANMVMLGAYIASKKVVRKESILEGLRYVLGEERQHLFEVNRKAFERGDRWVMTPQS